MIGDHCTQCGWCVENCPVKSIEMDSGKPYFVVGFYGRVLKNIYSIMMAKGCRNGTCKYPNCGIITCYQKEGVDFCFQCDEFPCEKTNFDSDLKYRWIQMNNQIFLPSITRLISVLGNAPIS